MKYLCLLLCVLISFYSSAQTNFNFKKDHDALLVKNLEISADFYQNILGLKEIFSPAIPAGKRWFELGNGVEIHLSQSQDEVPKNKSVHMAITTQKIDSFVEFLNSENIYFENWDGEARTVRIRADGAKQIYIRDPDGYWIEVNNNKLQMGNPE